MLLFTELNDSVSITNGFASHKVHTHTSTMEVYFDRTCGKRIGGNGAQQLPLVYICLLSTSSNEPSLYSTRYIMNMHPSSGNGSREFPLRYRRDDTLPPGWLPRRGRWVLHPREACVLLTCLDIWLLSVFGDRYSMWWPNYQRLPHQGLTWHQSAVVYNYGYRCLYI